jgi:heparan-sulfate lyase
MPEFKKAGEWLNEGTAKITEQVEAQFLGDGVHVELTPGYHIEAVYACNKLYNMAQVNNKVGYFPTNYVGLLKKAASKPRLN